MKQKLTLFFALIFCLAFTASTLAQAGKIAGTIVNEDGAAAEFATVMLKATADSSMVKAAGADFEGAYTLVGAPAGDYFVEVTYIGFANQTSSPFSYDGESFTVPQITMHVASQQLDEVQVVSSRPIVEVHPDKTVFNVQGSINATGNTALELLRKSPGVVVDNNDNIILAGKNGVKIYIDGRPSPLGAADLAAYLKTMQSTEIDNIEIIMNPSAKYDAEGNAGIINIIRRKDKSLGVNGTVNLGYRYGKNARYNGSTNFNYRNKVVNVFGQYGYSTGDSENTFFLYREQGPTESRMIYDQNNVMVNANDNHNFRLGTDFFLNKNSTLGFLFSGNVNDNENYGNTITNISSVGSGNLESILDASNEVIGDRNNFNFNVNFSNRGDEGQSWNVDLDVGRYRSDSESFQPNTYWNPARTEIFSQRTFSALTPTDINIYTAKVDREMNALGGKFGFGAKVSLVETDNTYDFFNIIDGARRLDTERSNNFGYEENINAAYVSFQKPLNDKWNLMLGLRVENTHSTGTLTTMSPSQDNTVTERDYTDLFPSGGITYQLNPKNSFRLNYSRRIDRPSYQDLNPFEYKLDELTFQQGNEKLQPQYSNAVSISHTYNYRLNTSLSYTHTGDVFTQITKALSDSTTVLTYANLAKQTNLALTVSYPFDVNKWWSIYGNLSGYRIHNSANINGDEIDLTAHVLSFYAQNTFLLPKGFKLELSGWYNSPALWEGNWTTNSMYSIDVGVQKKLFQDKATVKVSFSDIFDSQNWSGESRFGSLFMRGGGKWESQQIRVNFSYLFGNSQVKSVRKRSTGLEDEKSRIKSN